MGCDELHQLLAEAASQLQAEAVRSGCWSRMREGAVPSAQSDSSLESIICNHPLKNKTIVHKFYVLEPKIMGLVTMLDRMVEEVPPK